MREPRRDSRLIARNVGRTFGAATTPRARPGTGEEARHGRHRLQRCANRAEAGLLRQAWVTSLALLVGSIVAGCAGGPKVSQPGDVASSVASPAPVEDGSPPPRPIEPGQAWTNSIGMEFVWIPAGTFMIVIPDSSERQYEVRNRQGFWMGKYEVTQGQWAALMGGSPSFFADCGARCPVEGLVWPNPGMFIAKLNELEFGRGYRYRLPSGAEWEYAALAGTSRPRAAELGEISWYWENSGWTTHPVGMKRANGWGLHDMWGNASEWVLPDGNDPTGTVRIMISGGNYRSGSEDVWYQRSEEYPPQRVLDDFSPILTAGLRLVRTE